jgi:hypothetical protein
VNMFCAQCLQYSPINAIKILNDCSFQCLVCNNVNMFANEKAPLLSQLMTILHLHMISMFSHIHCIIIMNIIISYLMLMVMCK